jgi:hypothetical protein
MATSQIRGKIESVVANLSHTEPALLIEVANVPSWEQAGTGLSFTNTGNVVQTVTMNFVNDFINCTQVGIGKFIIGEDETPNPNIMVLNPNESGYYLIRVQVDEVPIGAPLTDWGFSADWTWS